MPEVAYRPIAYALKMTMGELVREINSALREISDKATENYWYGYPQIDANVIVSTTQLIWLPQAAFRIESISVKTSSSTASVTPRINGTAMGVTGGVPITATTTATRYEIASANTVVALDTVDLVVSGLGPGANLIAALSVRRTG